jgi:hypothetical protein
MTTNRKRLFAQLAIVAALALTAAGSLSAQVADLYVSTTSAQSTSEQSFVPVEGLSFDLPAATAAHKFAIVTLNMPNLYLSGTPSGTLGGEVGVLLSGTTQVATGQITADTSGILEEGRKPLTIVVKISLLSGVQSVQAVWTGVRNSTINTDTFSSMSAILTGN